MKADIAGLKRIPHKNMQIFVWDGFLPAHLCEHVIKKSLPFLQPSTVLGGREDASIRTSSTCNLGHIRDPFIDQLDGLIAGALGLPESYGETIQVQRYEVGELYKPHLDTFNPHPGSESYKKHIAGRGQRSWTFMVYLNEVERGGHTDFERIKQRFRPKAGRAVIWNNLTPDGYPNPFALHQGMPVKAGSKTIITKWFRDRPTDHDAPRAATASTI